MPTPFEDEKLWQTYSSILSCKEISFKYSEEANTAYYDIEEKSVTVPTWKWMDPICKQAIVSHEIGHAKYTNYKKSVFIELAEKYKDLFNIVEDARIERLMKKEYAGLSSIFSKGYSQLIKNEIFNIPEDKSELNLIERLNLYSKIGTIINIPFYNKEENTFAYRIMNLKTKVDVIELCEDLYNYIQENDMSASSLIDTISRKMNAKIKSMDVQYKNSDDAQEDKENNSKKRDNELIYLYTEDYYKCCLVDYIFQFGCYLDDKLVNKKSNRILEKVILDLAKKANSLFHQKMSAIDNNNIRHRRIGSIDTRKLARYQISENIFKQMLKLPKNKNHAIVILIDCSSSMLGPNKIVSEFIQALIFGQFCKMNNIPFTIYGYGFHYIDIMNTKIYEKNMLGYMDSYNKVFFLGNNYIFDIKKILLLANQKSRNSSGLALSYCNPDKNIRFSIWYGNTPTIEGLLIAKKKLMQYKRKGIEKTYLYLVTDGAYNECSAVQVVRNDIKKYELKHTYFKSDIVIDNHLYNIKDYKKYFRIDDSLYKKADWTFEMVLGNIKRETGCKIIYSYINEYSIINAAVRSSIRMINDNENASLKDNLTFNDFFWMKIPNLYFIKHTAAFEEYNKLERMKFDGKEYSYLYNFKNNPFIDYYMFLNLDVFKNTKISKTINTKQLDDTEAVEDYFKNINLTSKVFETFALSFISIFA